MYKDDDDEIEEIRELMYDLLKDFPTGATSKLLEEQYEKRYVDTGMGRPLPAHWLQYVQQADEFEIKQLSTVTMVYLVNVEFLVSPITTAISTTLTTGNREKSQTDSTTTISDEVNTIKLPEPMEDEIFKKTNKLLPDSFKLEDIQENVPPVNVASTAVEIYKLEAMALITMPTDVSVQAYVVFATDPDNIFIRLCSWDPVPDYLYSALMRVSHTEHDPPPTSKISVGQFLAAPINNVWERVRIVRKSEKFALHWVVFVVDAGFYHIVAHSDLRAPSDAVKAFTKIFLARIKLSNILPTENPSALPSISGSRISNAAKNESVKWSREAQHFVSAELTPSGNIKTATPKKVELILEGKWIIDPELKIPVANARIAQDNVDMGEKMVKMGFATKKKLKI